MAGFEATARLQTAPDALPDVMDSTLDFMIMDGTFAAGPVRAGKIRALAVTTGQRSPTFPNVPTMQEAGVKDFEFAPWWVAYVPAGTPKEIVDKLSGYFEKINATDDAKKFLVTIGSLSIDIDGKAADEKLKAELPKWERLVKAAKIEPQ